MPGEVMSSSLVIKMTGSVFFFGMGLMGWFKLKASEQGPCDFGAERPGYGGEDQQQSDTKEE